jgi:hypothetical protein
MLNIELDSASSRSQEITLEAESEVFQRKGDVFSETRNIKGLKIHLLRMTLGNKSLLGSDEYQTCEIVRTDMYRNVLSLVTKLYICFAMLKKVYHEIRDLFDIFIYKVWDLTKVNSTVLHSRVGYIKMVLDSWSFLLNMLGNIPPAIYNTCQPNLFDHTPIAITDFKAYIPRDLLLQSIGILVSLNDAIVSPPPMVPEPYLDGDKRIQVPTKNETQIAMAARNEFFTHQSTHLAAEKVRLLSEIGRFVTWVALIPNIETINIYEEFAVLWRSPKEDKKTIQNSIMNELSNYVTSPQIYEQLPKITLIIHFSGEEYEVEEMKTFANNEVIDKRELRVYLCDSRSEEMVLTTMKQHLHEDSEILYQEIKNLYPPTADLTIVAARKNKDNKISGFRSFDNEGGQCNSTIVYFSPFRFGFKFFARSLYFFALYGLPQENTKQDSGTSAQSIFSYSSQISTNYLVQVLERVRTLRKFDLSSSDDTHNYPQI